MQNITPGSAEGDLKTVEEDLRLKEKGKANKNRKVQKEPVSVPGNPDAPSGLTGLPTTNT